MGDANASIPTPQPQLPRPMFGAYGGAARAARRAVRGPGRARGRAGRPVGLRAAAGRGRRRLAPVQGRPAGEHALPRIEVDSETFEVRIDGELIEPQPVAELPMAQRYFLF